VEAGLRSYRKRMPEEINRILADHASTILFCPTETAVGNLQEEGFDNVAYGGRLAPLDLSELNLNCSPDDPLVINIGDVMFDSVLYNLKLVERDSRLAEELGLTVENYYLATVHRAENTDDPKRLEEIFSAFQEIAASGTKLLCPLHPRTRKALSPLRLGEWHPNLIVIEPVSYLNMLLLEKNARLILTDSGGVQKEAFMLDKPCVTLREETEWLETVAAGWNLLAGADGERILEAVEHFNSQRPPEPHLDPYGDGWAVERIAEVIASLKS